MNHHGNSCDVVVIGAGFGGLGTAMALAERGAKVTLLESLKYPGGCASTFEHRTKELGTLRFEAGATLFSGFGEGQLFRRWIDRYGLEVEVDWLDPVVELRTPSFTLPVPARRGLLIERLAALPGAPERRKVEAFFRYQRRVADALWGVLDDPSLLPPFGAGALLRHALRVPAYAPLLRIVGQPLSKVLDRFGVGGPGPLRSYLDALCQITVQCGVEEAEAPFALATMDYHFRGTGHVRGGIGRLAWGLVDGIRRLGGEVRFTERVKGLERDGNAWRVLTRRGEFRAGAVVANVLPQALKALLKDPSPGIPALDDLARQVEGGWGACMLYRAVRAGADDHPHHLELIQDEGAPFEEGNHLFCSSSGPADGDRAPQGLRTLTVSTHVPMATLRGLSKDERGPYVAGIQERMRRGLRRLAPELDAATELERTASPRTFERFTGRPHGYVGGVPRRAGTANYRQLIPAPVLPGLHLVGDTVFPGQSTLATALGGVKLAARLHGRGHADAAPRRRDDGAGLEIPIPS